MSGMHILTCIGLSNFISSLRSSIATRFSKKTLRLWKFDFAIYLRTVSVFPFYEKVHIDAIVYVLYDFTKYLIIHKFI